MACETIKMEISANPDFVSVIRKCLYPILVVSQTIPTITIAPLLIIWFGFEALPKILMVALTCFFPILISFVMD